MLMHVLPACVACSPHCSAGCYQAGAEKCDQCDPGFGKASNGSCARTYEAQSNQKKRCAIYTCALEFDVSTLNFSLQDKMTVGGFNSWKTDDSFIAEIIFRVKQY